VGYHKVILDHQISSATVQRILICGLGSFGRRHARIISHRGLAQTVDWFSDANNLSRYRPGTYVV
jgi:hypothetical protein